MAPGEAAGVIDDGVIADLCRRVRKLEEDEDFVIVCNGQRVEDGGAIASSGSEVDALREEVEKLRSMQKELESQLAKERYRIKHLIRAVGELVALKGNAGGFDRPSPLPST